MPKTRVESPKNPKRVRREGRYSYDLEKGKDRANAEAEAATLRRRVADAKRRQSYYLGRSIDYNGLIEEFRMFLTCVRPNGVAQEFFTLCQMAIDAQADYEAKTYPTASAYAMEQVRLEQQKKTQKALDELTRKTLEFVGGATFIRSPLMYSFSSSEPYKEEPNPEPEATVRRRFCLVVE